jgi:hypothetical protein
VTEILVSNLYLEDTETHLNAVLLNQNNFTCMDFIMAPSVYVDSTAGLHESLDDSCGE